MVSAVSGPGVTITKTEIARKPSTAESLPQGRGLQSVNPATDCEKAGLFSNRLAGLTEGPVKSPYVGRCDDFELP